MAGTTKLKRLATGYFLRKVIADTEALVANPESPTKLYLYSAHEKNIATLLVTLDLFDDALPAFGSYIIIEVHLVEGVYGYKVKYGCGFWQGMKRVLLLAFLSKLQAGGASFARRSGMRCVLSSAHFQGHRFGLFA